MNWSRVADPARLRQANATPPYERERSRAERCVQTKFMMACLNFRQQRFVHDYVRPGCCIECQGFLDSDPWVHIIVAPGCVSGLHLACHNPWQASQVVEGGAAGPKQMSVGGPLPFAALVTTNPPTDTQR